MARIAPGFSANLGMAEGSLTLPGDFDIVAPRTAPKDAIHGDSGEAQGLPNAA